MKLALLLLVLIGCKQSGDQGARVESDSTGDAAAAAQLSDRDFRAGAELLKKKDWDGARAAFERARSSSPHLADWATYYAASATANSGDTVATQTLFKQLDPSFQREWAWRARVTAFEHAKAYARGSAIADSAAARLNGQVRRSEALLRSAQLHMAAHDSAGALKAARLALSAGGTSPTGRAAADIMAKLVHSPADVLLVARSYYAAGSSQAVPMLKRARSLAKTAAEKQRITMQIGQAYFNRREYDAAIREVKTLGTRKDATGAQAQLLIARAHLREQRTGPARTAARAVIKVNPKSSSAASAYFLLGDMADDAGDIKSARANYLATIAISPRSENGVNSFMRIGLAAMARGDWKNAIAIFEQFSKAHATSGYAQQATFWLAQARDRAGQHEDAKALMQRARSLDAWSYYGMLTSNYLKAEPSPGDAGPQSSKAQQDTAERAAERVHVLKDVGFSDASAFELYRVTQDFKPQAALTYSFAEELVARNEAASAIRLGLQSYSKSAGWNQRLLKIVFPMPFEDLIVREAKAHKIDPYLVAALIRQESTFDPNALSRVGAVGLMQVMPKTAGLSTSSLKKPETNIRIGVAHLKTLIDHYNGQPAYLLAAYNAGQTPVGRWLKLPGAADPLLFVERIPYEETRGYAKIVQRNGWVYRILY